MNILFPIAGIGSRFETQGYKVPKPLVRVKGKSLIKHSVRTLNLNGNYIFVCRKYEDGDYNKQIKELINMTYPIAKLILLDKPTQGAAETCLAAEKYINNDDPLIITNGDQYLNWDSNTFLDHIYNTDPDGCVSLYDHEDIEVDKVSKYAFVALDNKGFATKFAEKFAISKHALNGIHYWKHGKDFVSSVKRMMADDVRVNGEFYFSPAFNYLIEDGKKITTFKMQQHEYYSLGSPEEIAKNLKYIN